MPGRIHIVGAGLAGLAAAVRSAGAGMPITIYEAANHAGGRARSYFDKELGCRIDNGNHLLLSANKDAGAYIAAIGADDTFSRPAEPVMPFLDLQTMERWSIRPNLGSLPWWIFAPARRAPGTHPTDYLSPFKLASLDADRTAVDAFNTKSLLYRRLWEPFIVAALNTKPEEASARLLWTVMQESFAKGGAALFPMVPKVGLSESLIDPALAFLAARGVDIKYGARLRRIEATDTRVRKLIFTDADVELQPDDRVLLSVPAQVVGTLGLDIEAPTNFRAIVNAHFRHAVTATEPKLLGLIGGFTEWLFFKPEIISTTNSAADDIVEQEADQLAQKIWQDVCRAMGLGEQPQPPWRIVKEKRATFAATPADDRRRPGPITRWRNLILAGDWTATGLPATIEGAIRSGHAAAAILPLQP